MADLQGIIAITDRGWFDFLRNLPDLAEANFWKPSARRGVRAAPYSPFLFKLKAPDNAICGFGYFVRYERLPAWLAWDTFGQANGCSTFREMQDRISTIRERIRYKEGEHPEEIGCVLIAQPIFFPERLWVSQPSDWPVRTQSEKWYSLVQGEGARVWEECLAAAVELQTEHSSIAEDRPRYGDPRLIRPRIGQGIFRVSITQAYSGACAMTGEHSLPALEASHIKPFGEGGPHEVPNGLLLRADLHRLFDKGYLTVTSDARIEVSNRLRTDFHNGKSYYPLHGESLRLPGSRTDWPDPEFLRWHNENVFAA
jgi:putative restriction endonuclease